VVAYMPVSQNSEGQCIGCHYSRTAESAFPLAVKRLYSFTSHHANSSWNIFYLVVSF
jgi:hypothetical protein